MSQNRRATPRRHTYRPAFLFTRAGAPLGRCVVKDISQCGAKLVYTTKEELPDQLLLTIDRDRIHCKLMWRRDEELGVRFGAVWL
jgi:hypothetical protein